MEVKINIEKLIEKVEITTLSSTADTQKTIVFAIEEALIKAFPKLQETIDSAVQEAVKAVLLENKKKDDILIEICLNCLRENPI